jgi:hypothetical protein
MQNFINNHKKLTLFLLVLVTGGLIWLVVVATLNTGTTLSSSNNPIEATQEGDNDTDQLIYYANSIYTIAQDEKDTTHISIAAYPGYRTAAVTQLSKLGFNPTDYNITFDYESPFKRYE